MRRPPLVVDPAMAGVRFRTVIAKIDFKEKKPRPHGLTKPAARLAVNFVSRFSLPEMSMKFLHFCVRT